MMNSSPGELLFHIGILLMVLSILLFLISAALFFVSGKRIRKQLEKEYGTPENYNL